MPKISKDEHIKLLSSIGTGNTSFFRQRARISRSHPDQSQDKSGHAFKLLNTFKDICNNPTEAISHHTPITLTRHYKSMCGPGDATRHMDADIAVEPLWYANPDLHENIKTLYDLNDEQMTQVSQALEKQVIDLLQQIFELMACAPDQKLFSSHKMLDKDLLLLLQTIDTERHSLLLNNIAWLKATRRPSYYTFHEEVDAHVQLVLPTINMYQRNPEFHKALFKIYLHMAYLHSEKTTWWSRHKRDIAQGVGVVLKIPLALMWVGLFSATLLLGVSIGLTPMVLGIKLSAYLFGYLAWQYKVGILVSYIATMYAAVSLMRWLGQDIENALTKLEDFLLVSSGQWIDRFLENAFDVKFFATDLAALFYEVQQMLPEPELPQPSSENDTGFDSDDDERRYMHEIQTQTTKYNLYL